MRPKDPQVRSCHQMSVFHLLILLISLLAYPSASHASMLLQRSVRDIPEHCRSMEPIHFSRGFSKILMSVEDLPADIKGVQTLEFPYSREDIHILWRYLRARAGSSSGAGLMSPLAQNPSLGPTLEKIINSHEDHGIDFRAEGDVLEIMGLLHFEEEYPANEYFVFSGLAYGKSNTQILGELDLIVARRSDCQVVLIGEAKANGHSLKEGYSQLQRFEKWLQTQLKKTGPICASAFHF